MIFMIHDTEPNRAQISGRDRWVLIFLAWFPMHFCDFIFISFLASKIHVLKSIFIFRCDLRCVDPISSFSLDQNLGSWQSPSVDLRGPSVNLRSALVFLRFSFDFLWLSSQTTFFNLYSFSLLTPVVNQPNLAIWEACDHWSFAQLNQGFGQPKN